MRAVLAGLLAALTTTEARQVAPVFHAGAAARLGKRASGLTPDVGEPLPTPIPSRGELVLIYEGWTWNENLAFGGGALFASDAFAGAIRRITRDAATGSYNVTTHIEPMTAFDNVAGLSVSEDGQTLYAAAHLIANGSHVVIQMGTAASAAGTFEVLAILPPGVKGNGMRLYKGVLYVSAEGDWLPGGGWLCAVDTATRVVTLLSHGQMWAADGLWISTNGTLYVGQLFERKLWVQDASTTVPANGTFISGPSRGGWLDDFTLDEGAGGGEGLFSGANWLDGRIDQWWMNGTMLDAPPLVTNLSQPTSCRWGSPADGFPATSLYISEGGGISTATKNRRTWELRNARDAV